MQATQTETTPETTLAAALNAGCRCVTLDRKRLLAHLDQASGQPGLGQGLGASHPHLFSATTVFISAAEADAIATAVAALERAIALPAFRAEALARAPAIAGLDPGPLGVLMGYDFHLVEGAPRLIEINTNAGGLLLNHALALAQRECCAGAAGGERNRIAGDQLPARVLEMFAAEWCAQRGDAALRSIAIVDDAPDTQFLAPEFRMFERLFRQAGISALVADARQLEWRMGRLWAGEQALDLVYNRLTDFALAEPAHAVLRKAYETGAVVLTPHPRAHALHADKRNLVTLGDDAHMAAIGLGEADRKLLHAVVPRSLAVTAANADELWSRRRDWFFKPSSGYGSKATYRGDKLTRRVWDTILAGGYIAQRVVPPPARSVQVGANAEALKFDLRAYTYAGEILLLAARTWSGQTTNFRTAGGGFAPVVVI